MKARRDDDRISGPGREDVDTSDDEDDELEKKPKANLKTTGNNLGAPTDDPINKMFEARKKNMAKLADKKKAEKKKVAEKKAADKKAAPKKTATATTKK